MIGERESHLNRLWNSELVLLACSGGINLKKAGASGEQSSDFHPPLQRRIRSTCEGLAGEIVWVCEATFFGYFWVRLGGLVRRDCEREL
jgi:hypothetical protein